MNRRTFLITFCSVTAAFLTLLAEAAPPKEVTLKITGMT